MCSLREGGGYGQAMVLGNFECRGFLLIWIIEGQGHTVLAEGRMRFIRVFCYQIYIYFFFLPLSGRRFDSDRNTVSKSRKNQDNQPNIAYEEPRCIYISFRLNPQLSWGEAGLDGYFP